MTARKKEVWVSPRNWLLTAHGEFVRPVRTNTFLGLGREGGPISQRVEVSTAPVAPRRMFELFTSHGYAILDEESAVVSLSGPISVKDVVSGEAWRNKLTIEEFIGEVRLPPWDDTFYVGAPHVDYLPETVGRRVMSLALHRTGQDPYVIPRPLFGCAQWLLRHLAKTWASSLGLEVENRTFPCEMIIAPGESGTCRVLATSTFIEPNPVQLTVTDHQWNLICDGLVIA